MWKKVPAALEELGSPDVSVRKRRNALLQLHTGDNILVNIVITAMMSAEGGSRRQ